MSETGAAPSSVVRGVRRAAIIAIIASLVVAALLGIVALLGGDFGEIQGKVILTTLTVAAFGTTALCHLAVVARKVRVVGFIGIAASAGAALCALVLIWSSWFSSSDMEGWWRALGALSVVAVSLAQVNLLLLLVGRRQSIIRVALVVTLVAIAVVAALLLTIILSTDLSWLDGTSFARTIGIAAIVDALGTIALPILGLVLRPPPDQPGVEPEPLPDLHGATLTVELPPGLAARVEAAASRAGMPPEQFAIDALARAID